MELKRFDIRMGLSTTIFFRISEIHGTLIRCGTCGNSDVCDYLTRAWTAHSIIWDFCISLRWYLITALLSSTVKKGADFVYKA